MGTHFCYFYETKQDLLDTLIPYFKAGLESNEFCLWVVTDPDLITVHEAKQALEQAVPDLDRHLAERRIEILNGYEWYLKGDAFSLERVTSAWGAKLEQALALGYEGMRVSGDTLWVGQELWQDFHAYEKQLDSFIVNKPMTALCTYSVPKSGAAVVLDVVDSHQFTIARRQGKLEVVEAQELTAAKAEIKRLNEEFQLVTSRGPEPTVVFRFGVAVLSVITALLIRLAMEMQVGLESTPIVALFICAVMFSSWFGGYIPGLLAIAFSVLAIKYYFATPLYSFAVDSKEVPRIIIFSLSALFVGLLSAAQRNSAQSLGRARDVLDETVRQPLTNEERATANSDRQRAENELRQSEDRLRTVIDTTPIMSWSTRPDGVVDFLNQRWMDYTGLSLEEYVKNPSGPVHPDDIQRVIGNWLVAKAANGEPYDDEMRSS